MSDRPVLHPDTQWTLVGEFKATRDVLADADDFLRYCEEITGHSLWQDLGCALVQQHRSLNLSSDWSVTWTQPQNAAFVTACETGDLYMITSGNPAYRPKGDRFDPNTWHETADLYKVSQRDGHFTLELIAKRRVRAVHEGSCTLRAAGSVHVTPAGELLFYCNTHHPDDGGDGPMKFEEYRLSAPLSPSP